jgi:hypothetical protein
MKRKREPVNACETAAAKETREDLRDTSRRGFLQGGVGLVAGAAAAQLLPSQAAAQQNAANAGLLGRLTSANSNGRPILLKDGIVLSRGRRSFRLGRAWRPSASRGGQRRSHDRDAGIRRHPPSSVYGGDAKHRRRFADPVRHHTGAEDQFFIGDSADLDPCLYPDDVHISELVASLSQVSDGVTTTVDTSEQITDTPERVDAAIAALKQSGRRALFNVCVASTDKFAAEMARVRKQYFSSDD